jgi:two-component system, sensor histidine kinase PdtaS
MRAASHWRTLGTISFKYAYQVGQSGNVNVDFKRSPIGWRLEVSDEGQGLPEGFDIDQSSGFGMQVVKAFVRQLSANMTVSSRSGHTVFQIDGSLG